MTGTDLMTDADRRLQSWHDARHPGKACRSCPIETRSRQAMSVNTVIFSEEDRARMWIIGLGVVLVLLLVANLVLVLR